jgi:SNF2 family DNA or RNA helicase
MLNLQLAHHIRNRASQTFRAACSIKSYYRWCLTGTPIHNSLDDYGALLSFLGVPDFTEKTKFDFWIAKPMHEKKPEGFARLQTLVRGACLRRTKESIGDVLRLPHRQEKVEYVLLHQNDQILYDFFKERSANLASGLKTNNTTITRLDDAQDGGIIRLLNFLRLICNHGEQLLPDTALRIWKARDRPMTASNEFINSGINGDSPRYSAKVLALLKNLIATLTPTNNSSGKHIPVKRYECEQTLVPRILTSRSVVFSYWTRMLDLIQQALSCFRIATCRIDGSTSLEGRNTALKKFAEDADCSVMLATIGSAGEG